MHRTLLLCGMLCILASCDGVSESAEGDALPHRDPADSERHDDPEAHYAEASSLAMAGDHDGAFDALQRSMRAGYAAPSDVLCSESLRSLLDDPQWRPRVRELLKSAARESSISMVRPDEPGEPMVLTVRIVSGRDESPGPAAPPAVRKGIVVGIVHVNAAGYYQPWTKNEDWNPRHFGFAVTDETGTVVVRTIRPGYYAPEYEAPNEPAHVHYDIEYKGEILRASEFFFEDDPRLVADGRDADGQPIASMVRDDEGVWRAEVTIPVWGLR